MPFTNSPDLCLFSIFDQLPLNDLIQISRVCSKWNTMRYNACLRRRHLSIEIGRKESSFGMNQLQQRALPNTVKNVDFGIRKIGFFDSEKDFLTVHSFDEQILTFLKANFCNVNSLELVFNEQVDFDILIEILDFLKPKLRTLKLWFRFVSFADCSSCNFDHSLNGSLNRLLAQLAVFSNLKNLTFEIFNFVMENWSQSLNFPLLGHLEEFVFNSHDYAHIWSDSFKRYAVGNDNLRRIALGNRITNSGTMEQYRQLPAKLKSKFVHLDVKQLIDHNYALLNPFFNNFSQLTTISLFLESSSIGSISKILSPLQQLVSLRLELNLSTTVNQVTKSNQNPLTSIKVLTLMLSIPNHECFEKLNLATLFSNVQHIQIQMQKICFDCKQICDCARSVAEHFMVFQTDNPNLCEIYAENVKIL